MSAHPIFEQVLSQFKPKEKVMRMSAEEVMERENDTHFQQQADEQRHRELDLKEALDECHAKGISPEAMQTLLRETGARWQPRRT